MQGKEVTLYGDLISQPYRAVLIFLLINKIPHKTEEVKLMKGEHFSDEYKKINPFQKVPVLVEGDMKLFESHAIMKYLVATRNLD